MGRRGFSLVELMVTLAVIGVIAGIAVPYVLASLPTYRLSAAVRQVVGDLRLARTTAVDRGADVLIQFHSPAANQYVMAVDTDDDHAITPADEGLKTVDLPGLYPGVVIASNHGPQPDGVAFQFNGVPDLAQFTPRGTGNGGSVYLRGATRTDDERQVAVLSTTARAHAARWDPGSGTFK